MYVMSTWALLVTIRGGLVRAGRLTGDPVPWVALVLVGLAVLMLVEAIRVLAGFAPRPPRAPEAVPVPASPGGGTA
jgi:hypothetical protein